MTLTVVGTDREEVRDRLRRALGDSRDVDEALARAHDGWLVGTVDEVAERLVAYEAAGVSRVMLQQLDHADSELTALIGDRLVPAVHVESSHGDDRADRRRGGRMGPDRPVRRARRPQAGAGGRRGGVRGPFRSRYHGKVAQLRADRLAEAVAERERIESQLDRALAFAHLRFATNMADPARGALLARLQERAAAMETKVLFFGLEWAAVEDEQADALLADEAVAYWPALPHLAAQVPPVPAQRAGGGADREDGLGRVGLVTPLRRAARRATGSDRGRGRLHRDGHGSSVFGRPRDASGRRRAITEALQRVCARGRSRSTPSSSTSPSTTGCGLPHLDQRAEPRQRDHRRVQALVDAVVSRYEVARRYYRLKARLLGLDRLAHWDRFAPLTDDTVRVSWDEARSLVVAYSRLRRRVRRDRRRILRPLVDRCTGAAGQADGRVLRDHCSRRHPYVLMNYTGDRRSVLTLAHELGHGLHGVLAQPLGLFNASTPLTTAETASVFGEALTFKRLLEAEDDPRHAGSICSRVGWRTPSRRSARSR